MRWDSQGLMNILNLKGREYTVPASRKLEIGSVREALVRIQTEE